VTPGNRSLAARSRPKAAISVLALLAACAPAREPATAVELDGYEPARAELLRAAGWKTDFSRTSVPLDALRASDLARDAFVPIAAPRFAPAAEVELDPAEPVLVHRVTGGPGGAGGVRGWPLAHLLRRELARDSVDGAPVAVTLCSLCASARAFDLRLDGEVLDLAVSALLLDGNALLYDRRTESLWRQRDGEAVAGAHAGRRLRALPTFTVSFGALRAAHPEAAVMLAPERSREPPIARLSADDVARGVPPTWLRTACADPLALVLSLDSGAGDALVLRDARTSAPHRAGGGGPGPALGSEAAFRTEVGGRALTFDLSTQSAGARDRETGSRWNVLGEAVAGPLRGTWLAPLPQVQGFRFALGAAR